METCDKKPINDNAVLSTSEQNSIQFSEKSWEIAKKRHQILEPLRAFETVPIYKVKEACQKLNLDRSSFFRLFKKYKDSNGEIGSLAPQAPKGGIGRSRLKAKIEQIIIAAIDKIYLSKQRYNIKAVVTEVRRRCIEASLKPPCKTTIYKRVRSLDTRLSLEKRKGKLAAHSFTPNLGPSVTADYPLQAFMMDHTKVDLILVDEFQRLPIGRPWLSVAIDIYSRCIAGFYLSFEAPSSVSVGLCLTHAVFTKENYLKKFEINGRWPVFGKPENLYVDQAAEFKSEALLRGCEQNGIKIFWRKVGAPHLHGIIERLIGTLMKEVHTLPGTTFSNPKEKGNYDSCARASLTLRELEKWFIHMIVGQYHLDIHSSLTEPPLARYTRGMEALHSPPVQITNEKSFLIDFLPVVKRTIQRHGFVIDYIYYYSNALSPWISSRNKDTKFIIRRDPRDLSRIFVLHPKETHYLEIPYRNMSLPLISIWEHRESLRRIKEKGLSNYDEGTIFKTISEMRRLVKDAEMETKTARKNRAIAQARKETTPSSVNVTKQIKSTKKYDPSEFKPFDEIEEW
jgi:putative transposase